MNTRTYDPKSSFFRLATTYNLMDERDIAIFKIRKTNICEYSTKVIKGFFAASLLTIGISLGCGMVLDFSLWVYTGLMYAWVFPHLLAGIFILLLGLIALGAACHGIEVAWKALRNKKREKKSSFVKDALYSVHNKVCFEVDFKKEDNNG